MSVSELCPILVDFSRVVDSVGDCVGRGRGSGKGDRALQPKIDVHGLQLNVVDVFFHATMKTAVQARRMIGMAREPCSMMRFQESGNRYVVVCSANNEAFSKVVRKK